VVEDAQRIHELLADPALVWEGVDARVFDGEVAGDGLDDGSARMVILGPRVSSLTAVGNARREELKAKVTAADAPPPLLHPGMADLYRQKVTALAQALEQPENRTEATEALRGLVDAITLTPEQGALRIELKGNLAAMLGATQNAKRSPETGDLSQQVVMVAGARNPLNLEFSWTAA
jgi:hypothetical protein